MSATMLASKVESELDTISVDVELIIVGFNPSPAPADAQQLIFKVAFENVYYEQNFACIGAGSVIAEQVLHRRKQRDLLHIAHTLYNVYEAKRESEMAPSVGGETFMFELRPPTKKDERVGGWLLNADSLAALKKYYKHYGLKDVKRVHFNKPRYKEPLERN